MTSCASRRVKTTSRKGFRVLRWRRYQEKIVKMTSQLRESFETWSAPGRVTEICTPSRDPRIKPNQSQGKEGQSGGNPVYMKPNQSRDIWYIRYTRTELEPGYPVYPVYPVRIICFSGFFVCCFLLCSGLYGCPIIRQNYILPALWLCSFIFLSFCFVSFSFLFFVFFSFVYFCLFFFPSGRCFSSWLVWNFAILSVKNFWRLRWITL